MERKGDDFSKAHQKGLPMKRFECLNIGDAFTRFSDTGHRYRKVCTSTVTIGEYTEPYNAVRLAPYGDRPVENGEALFPADFRVNPIN